MDDRRVEDRSPSPVDAALARLADLDDRPLDEHVEAYEDVHRLLQAALGELPAEVDPAGPPGT